MKKINEFGWRKAFALYSVRLFVKACTLPLIISGASLPFAIISEKRAIYFIDMFSSLIIDVLPGIIGFLLGGYAIIIGFSSNEIVKFMSKKSKKSDRTLYQKQNAVFAVSILSLMIGLISSIIINFISRLELNYFPDYCMVEMFNYLVVFVLFFIIYFSVFSIKDMVINVFNFGQLIHYLIQKQKK